MKMSLRARLTVFYAVVLVIVLCSFAAEIWWVEGRLGLGRVDRELDGLSATVANLIAAEMMEEPNVASAALEAARAVAVPDRAVAIFDADTRRYTCSIIGRPSRSASALPGSRVDAYRAGMMATMLSGGTESTFEPVDAGCTTNNNTPSEGACYDRARLRSRAKTRASARQGTT